MRWEPTPSSDNINTVAVEFKCPMPGKQYVPDVYYIHPPYYATRFEKATSKDNAFHKHTPSTKTVQVTVGTCQVAVQSAVDELREAY